MGKITVDLTRYPKFWMDFAARGSAFDPSALVTREQFERWMLEWYGLSVKAVINFTIGTVTMDEVTYTAFALRWS